MYLFNVKFDVCVTYNSFSFFNELLTEIKDAPTVPAFASDLNKFYAF